PCWTRSVSAIGWNSTPRLSYAWPGTASRSSMCRPACGTFPAASRTSGWSGTTRSSSEPILGSCWRDFLAGVGSREVAPAPPTPGTGAWVSAAERGSILGMRFVVWCYRALGRRFCQLLILPVVLYFFATDRKGRRASLRYLRRLYGRPGGPEALGR